MKQLYEVQLCIGLISAFEDAQWRKVTTQEKGIVVCVSPLLLITHWSNKVGRRESREATSWGNFAKISNPSKCTLSSSATFNALWCSSLILFMQHCFIVHFTILNSCYGTSTVITLYCALCINNWLVWLHTVASCVWIVKQGGLINGRCRTIAWGCWSWREGRHPGIPIENYRWPSHPDAATLEIRCFFLK